MRNDPSTLADIPDSRSPLVPKSPHVGVHKAKIESGLIVWELTGGFAAEPILRVSDFKLLEEFAGLGFGTDEELLRFARKYGPLNLCKHGFALGHRRTSFNSRCYESNIEAEDLTRGTLARESVEAWRRYIRRAKGILGVAAKLHEGRKTSSADWSWIARKEDGLTENPLVAVLAEQPRRTPSEQRGALARALNHWLDECEVGISIEWLQPGIDFRIGRSDPLGRGSSVLIAIGVQLLRAVLRQESFVWCSNCGSPYIPERWPRAGEMHYCRAARCGRKAALRNAQRKFRREG